jgi:3-deoxy-D-manno-octulosonate 8-phosphate phosphatase (KDO 8-P phosphatase)
LNPIKLLILDVDGVMTGGDLPYVATGVEVKTFFVQDGGAIRLWLAAGNSAAIISGRDAPAVCTRARDLGITFIRQGVRDKLPPYEEACGQAGVSDDQVAFVGDDWLDLPPMRRCGYPIAVANAASAVKRAARYVTRRNGGQGGVSEAIERLFRHNGQWSTATAKWRTEL